MKNWLNLCSTCARCMALTARVEFGASTELGLAKSASIQQEARRVRSTLVLVLALCLLSCRQGGPAEHSTEMDDIPPDAPATTGAPEGKLSGDWRGLFGPFGYPQSLEQADVYHCPEMPNVPKFVKSLWPYFKRAQAKWDRNRQAGAVNYDGMYQALNGEMFAHIKDAGCTQINDAVPVKRIIIWDAIDGSNGRIEDEYVNAERWIAYQGVGRSRGFFLAQSATVD